MEVLIPIVFFICVVYAIKVVVDARARSKLVSANVSDELLKSMLVVEEQQRRHSSLRWGIVLTFIAVGFGLIEAFGWKDATPGAVAVLIGATGVGNLAFYWLARQMESKDGASGENRQK